MPEEKRRYGLSLGLIILAVAAAAIAALYYLYGRPEVVSLEQVFGEPTRAPMVEAAHLPIRPTDIARVREGDIHIADEPRVQAPAAPEPTPPPPPTPLEIARAHAARKEWDRALHGYDALLRAHPDDDALAIERARVLAWSGHPDLAADALVPVLEGRPRDAALQFERGQFLWWSGATWAADSALSRALALNPSLETARALRRDVRRSVAPSVAVARGWLEDDPTPSAELTLARALAREERYAEALPVYRAAMTAAAARAAPADSVRLEAVDVAIAADSLDLAARVLVAYLRTHPDDAGARLRLARVYTWAERPDSAVAEYTRLLRRSDDPQLRLERATVLTTTSEWPRARPDLLAVVAARPRDAKALKLLGDVARWDGAWQEALDLYRRAQAVEPDLAGVAVGISDAEHMLAVVAESRDTVAVRPRVAWSVNGEAFGDSEEFRWYETTARWGRILGAGPGSGVVGLSAAQGFSQGARLGAGSPEVTGWGLGAWGRIAAGRDVVLSGEAGLRAFSGVGAVPSLAASIALAHSYPTRLELNAAYGPAVRRVATAAALEADVRSARLQAVAEHYGAAWGVASDVEYEHLSSYLGGTNRVAGSVTVQRLLARGFYGVAGLGFVSADVASPLLPGWGSLYWTPEYYVAPQVGIRLERPLNEAVHATLRVNPGYAFVRERPGSEIRFDRERVPFLGAGLDVIYSPASYDFGVSADWSGALDAGYRAAALRAWLSPHVRWP